MTKPKEHSCSKHCELYKVNGSQREGAREWGRGTHYISMGRDMLTKGVLFSESVWNGGVFHCKKSEKEFRYTCLESGSCLSGKVVVN